jgi:hypothetical protein
MNYAAFAFLALIAATLAYTAARLGLGIYQDYRAAGEVRRQLLQRLRLLPLQPVLSTLGLTPQELLYAYPLHDVESLIRDCESCRCKKACDAALGHRDDGFEFCPVRNAILAKTRNMTHQPSPA